MVLQFGTRPLADEQERDEGPMLGMPETKTAARSDSADAQPGTRAQGSGGAGDAYVLSGMVRNENQIVGHGAIFRETSFRLQKEKEPVQVPDE
jgi:hypothetical protein